MSPQLPKGTRIAPVRYRLLTPAAGLGALLTAMATIMAGTIAFTSWRKRSGRGEPTDGGDAAPAERLRPHRLGRWFDRRAVQLGGEILSVLTAVRHRNRQSRLYRRLGLRRVDARTGGPLTVRSAVIAYAIPKASLWLIGRTVARPRPPSITPEELRLRREQIEREHRDDPEGMRRALDGLHKEARTGCATTAGWLFGTRLVLELPVLIPPLHQSLPDRLAGVLVVQDLRR